MDAAVKAAKVVVATCMLCGATVGPSASPTSAEAGAVWRGLQDRDR
ncbi:MAG TPA: hypothetical protein VEO01_35240 [Pseudonocardiaceae bacterium]|nr:hypothetical protein [Pseudonocardiaceae bacterium]